MRRQFDALKTSREKMSNQDMINLDPNEIELIKLYRQLDERGQRAAKNFCGGRR